MIRSTQRRQAFTLVELLVVIGIIALLISILLPSLGKAREQAVRVQCASNMKSVGQALYMFANDNKGLLPMTQACIWGDTPWQGDYMYLKHYVMLVDDYGVNESFFVCPFQASQDANTRTWLADNFAPAQGADDAWTMVQAREFVDGTLAFGSPANDKPHPVWPTPSIAHNDPGAGGGTWFDSLAILPGYYYLGGGIYPDEGEVGQLGQGITWNAASPWGGNMLKGNPGDCINMPWDVKKITSKTRMGLGFDQNPPVLIDKVGLDDSGIAYFNHGKVWYRDVNDNHKGDVGLDVLFRDGHVEHKTPFKTPYWTFGGSLQVWY
jgi:prepilin-type N-terminal cleavage/methylation domain-containing protein